MQCLELDVIFPRTKDQLEQNEEYFILGPDKEKIQFHDYERIYKTPGLYEKIFHEKLKCQSPRVIAEMLHKLMNKEKDNLDEIKVLDYGAGNGLVAEALQTEHPELIVGIDIIEEAKEAALRDRSEVYEDYFVTDLGEPEEEVIEKLQSYDLNTLVSVAALGFGHIPPQSFINAFNLIEQDGYIVFNLRDKFLMKDDNSGFKKTLDWLADNYIDIVEEKTYVHRLSVNGDPIHYTAIAGKKLNAIQN